MVTEAVDPYQQSSIDLNCFDTLISAGNLASPSATSFAPLTDTPDLRRADRCSTLSIPSSDMDIDSYAYTDGESTSVALSNNSILCNSPMDELDFTGVVYAESKTPTGTSPPALVRRSSARESRVMGLQELHHLRECLWNSLTKVNMSPQCHRPSTDSADEHKEDEDIDIDIDIDIDASFVAQLPPSQHRFQPLASSSPSENPQNFIGVCGRASVTQSESSMMSSTRTLSGEFGGVMPLPLKASMRKQPSMSKPFCKSPLPRESVAVLIDAVRASSLQDDDKCRFVFDLFDVGEQGVLSRERVAAFVEATLLANNLKTHDDSRIDDMVDQLFTNSSNQNQMTYKEFRRVFNLAVRGPTNVVATTVAPVKPERQDRVSEPASAEQPQLPEYKPSIHYRPSLVAERTQNFWQRKIMARYHKYPAEINWLAFYLAVLLAAFVIKASCVPLDPATGSALRIAKGSSQVILVNACFLLLPMCRGVVTYLSQFGSITIRVPIEKHLGFHKICGVVMLVSSLIHMFAWGLILHRIQTAPEEVWHESHLLTSLGFVRDQTLWDLLSHLPMWTGNVMLVIVIIAAPLAHAKIHRRHFNTFWVSHLLFVLLLVLLLIHGLAMWVQTPQALMWVLPPLALYVVEKRYRMAKLFGGHSSITRVEFSHDTVAIFMKKPKNFEFQPGMYLLLNVPVISRLDWHPFTISSAPEDEYLSVHVRNLTAWTDDLHKMLQSIKDHCQDSATVDLEANTAQKSPYPSVCIDGPIGTPSQEYYRYQSVVFVNAGPDDVTPLASILRSIVHQWESFKCPCCEAVAFPRKFQVQKVYFYWVTRRHESLAWFTEFMDQLAELDTEGRLEVHSYFTDEPAVTPQQPATVDVDAQQDVAAGESTATRQVVHVGRPDWSRELLRIANEQEQRNHQMRRNRAQREAHDEQQTQAALPRVSVDASCDSNDVAVFFRGPSALGRTIHDECARFNLHQQRAHDSAGVTFDFRRESFY